MSLFTFSHLILFIKVTEAACHAFTSPDTTVHATQLLTGDKGGWNAGNGYGKRSIIVFVQLLALTLTITALLHTNLQTTMDE